MSKKKKKKGMKLKLKPFINKTNKQVSLALPKRKIKKKYPDIKFNDDLFVELKILRKAKKRNG